MLRQKNIPIAEVAHQSKFDELRHYINQIVGLIPIKDAENAQEEEVKQDGQVEE